MSPRGYDLGRRQAGAAKTRAAILAAARDLLTAPEGVAPSAGAIAARAGVSRLSLYHHFGSRSGLMSAVASAASEDGRPRGGAGSEASAAEQLRGRIAAACDRWASDPILFRRLPAATEVQGRERDRELAARLAEGDLLRAGCSLKEAQDVIGLLASFAAFDTLHQDGRRSAAAVAEILVRMAGAVLRTPA